MSLVRPARAVTAPDGGEWEVYVSRTALPPWRAGPGGDGVPVGRGAAWTQVESPLGHLWHEVLRPLALFVLELPLALVRSSRSRTIRIEAVTFVPRREGFVWTTTGDHADAVLRRVCAGLEAGELARPLGAVFRGRDA